MLFTSFPYVALLAATVSLRWLLPARARLGLLIGASFVFYASAGRRALIVLGFATLVSWVAGLALARFPARARPILLTAVVSLVGALVAFKYGGFVLEQLRALGLGVPERAPAILPLGISFYTFTALAYVLDVARGEPADRSLAAHVAMVCFFPTLVAGPILRKRELGGPLAHLDAPFDPDRFSTGVLLVLLGFFKKMVLADGLAAHASAVFASPMTFSGAGVRLGILAYAGQILCDFSGYSDIAIGSAKLLGIDLPKNFDLPYLASSPADFWRRWHITLSRWLRDYLWVAVGGNGRNGAFRLLAPIFTMAIAGLWHGAAWTFVAWGLYHGVLLAGHQLWVRATKRVPRFDDRVRDTFGYRALAVFVTFTLVTLGWVLFRAPTFAAAAEVLSRAATRAPGPLGAEAVHALELLAVVAFGHVVAAGRWADETWAALPGRLRGLVWLALVAALYVLSAPPTEFIYFTF